MAEGRGSVDHQRYLETVRGGEGCEFEWTGGVIRQREARPPSDFPDGHAKAKVHYGALVNSGLKLPAEGCEIVEEKVKFFANGDTMVPAYLALLEKGYQVSCSRSGGAEMWMAIKDDKAFLGDGPLMALGLISLHEIRGSDWRAADNEIEAFMDRYYPIAGESGERARDEG